jgi:hypothetical protein
MSTFPAIDWTQHGTTTPSRYRFVLSFVLYSEAGTLELVNAPIEWKEIELLLKRDPETHGVYISAVVSTLTFIKEGRNLLVDLYEEKGVFASCHLYIYYLDFATREYLSMPSRYKLDFNTYKLVNLTRTTNGVQINCLEDDIVSKFQQRKNTTVDLRSLKGLSEFEIDDYTALLKDLAIPEISIYQFANYATDGTGNLSGGGSVQLFAYVPLRLIDSDIAEAMSEIGDVGDRDFDNGIIHAITDEETVIVKGTIYLYIGGYTGDAITLRLSVVSSDDTEYDGHQLAHFTSGFSGTKTIDIDDSIVVPAGKSLGLILTLDAAGAFSYNLSFTSSFIQASVLVSSAPATVVQSYPVYEAIERNLQIILDCQFPMYSEFFGRTDTPYNLTPDYYVSENQLRFANILSGLNIRGMHHTDDNNPHPIRFMDLFNALKAVWCIGGGFETVGTETRFRIEDLAHFYQESETLDLSARVNELEIQREQDSARMFARIRTGYSKFDYEAVLGRGEYNTAQDRTTIVPNDNELNIVCPLRADTRGILECLLKSIESTGTEDTKGDADLFIIKTQRGAIQDWDAETDENIAIENNTSLFQSGSLNLYMTPLRNLIRNGRIVNAGLAKVPGTEITYQTSDKNATLETTGEGITIIENQAIATEDLATPLWYPEILTIELPFYEADYIVLAASPLGYITLSDNYSGWVIDVRWKFAQNSATLKLLRRIPV